MRRDSRSESKYSSEKHIITGVLETLGLGPRILNSLGDNTSGAGMIDLKGETHGGGFWEAAYANCK